MRRNNFIVCVVGFPGVGKLTIARALSRMTGATVIDNHWINDPIIKLVAMDGSSPVSEAVWPQVAKVREAVLETIATLAPQDASYIFTYAGSNEDPNDRKAFEDYRDVAIRRGSPFSPLAWSARKRNWSSEFRARKGGVRSLLILLKRSGTRRISLPSIPKRPVRCLSM